MMEDSDIKAMVRLLAEVSILEGDLVEKKRGLLSRLCGLVSGESWTWSLHAVGAEEARPRCLEQMTGRSQPLEDWPGLESIMTLATGTFPKPITNTFAPGSPIGAVSVLPSRRSRPAGKSRQMTIRNFSADLVSSVSLSRKARQPPFDEREIKIAEIVLSELPWLHEKSPPARKASAPSRLTPRQRETLLGLVNGLNRHVIAEKLAISPHTVHGYIKQLYRLYQVQSQADLIVKFKTTRLEEKSS